MTSDDIQKIRDRVKTYAIRQRAHSFLVAYTSLRETLNSTDFMRIGRATVRYWPGYWHDRKAIESDSLKIKDIDGKLNVAIRM